MPTKTTLKALLVAIAAASTAAGAILDDMPVSKYSRDLTPEELQEVMEGEDVDIKLSDAILYKGLELSLDEDYENSIPYFVTALDMDPTRGAAWEGLGWAHWRLEERDLAIALWNRFRTLAPESPVSYRLLAQADTMMTDWAGADANFRKSLMLDPLQYDVRVWFSQNLLRMGLYQEAETNFRYLFQVEPARLDVKIALARMLYQRQEFTEAAEYYREIIAEFPDEPSFIIESAMAELQLENVKLADELCAIALELDPENSRALMMRVDIAELAELGDVTVERMRDLLDLMESPTDRAQLRMRLGARYSLVNKGLGLKEKRYSNGQIFDEFRKAIDECPNMVEAYIMLSEVAFSLGEYDVCREYAKKVLDKFNINHTRAYDMLFEVALMKNDFDMADNLLVERYAKFDSENPIRFYQQARVYFKRGEYSNALKFLDLMDDKVSSGSVLTLVYHGLTPGDWMPTVSARRLFEHLSALKREGFTIIKPSEIRSTLERLAAEEKLRREYEDQNPPWPARAIREVKYWFTGRKAQLIPDDVPSRTTPKYVAVTFDDGHRSSFAFGTPVAEAFETKFGMFMVLPEIPDYVPSVAGWSEIEEFVRNGQWEIGSLLESAHIESPVDPDGFDKRHPLSNRLWHPARKRVETLTEWYLRVKREFAFTRKELARRMGAMDSKVAMVAYPFGDVGTADSSNLFKLSNPMSTITSEAGRQFDIGFILNRSGLGRGFTSSGMNLMAINRYEPNWKEDGDALVKNLYSHHPTFLSRIMRIQIGMTLRKPHTVADMIAGLRADGYPEMLCRELELVSRAHFMNRTTVNRDTFIWREFTPQSDEEILFAPLREKDDEENAERLQELSEYSAADIASGKAELDGDEEKEPLVVDETKYVGFREQSRPLIAPHHLWLGGEVYNMQANDDYATTRYGVNAGLGLNERASLSARYGQSEVKQKVIRRKANRDYLPDVPESYTNLHYSILRSEYTADTEDYSLRYSYTFSSGTAMSASIGRFTFDPTGETHSDLGLLRTFDALDGINTVRRNNTMTTADFSISFFPTETISSRVFYMRNAVATGHRLIPYDSVGFANFLKFDDKWHVNLNGQYWVYADDNSMFSASSDSFWEVYSDLGLWFGLELSVNSAADPNPFYWAPLWDTRLLGVIRMRKEYEGYQLILDSVVGFCKGRDWQETDWHDGIYEVTGFSNSDYTTGFTATYRRSLLDKALDLAIDAQVMLFRDYIDHSLRVSLNYNF